MSWSAILPHQAEIPSGLVLYPGPVFTLAWLWRCRWVQKPPPLPGASPQPHGGALHHRPFKVILLLTRTSLVAQPVKESTCNAGDTEDTGLIPELGRSLEERNGYPLQYSCPGNLMDRGAWRATVPSKKAQAQ